MRDIRKIIVHCSRGFLPSVPETPCYRGSVFPSIRDLQSSYSDGSHLYGGQLLGVRVSGPGAFASHGGVHKSNGHQCSRENNHFSLGCAGGRARRTPAGLPYSGHCKNNFSSKILRSPTASVGLEKLCYKRSKFVRHAHREAIRCPLHTDLSRF